MRSDIVPGAVFPDYELPDHTTKRRKLSELLTDYLPSEFTGADMPPMICQLSCVRIHVCVIRNASVLTSAPSLLAQVALIR